jgi:hypothetical protein
MYWDVLLRARLLLPSSPRTAFLRVDQGTCGTGILVQYADQPGETIDRGLLFWTIPDVVHDDLEGGLRRLLVSDCTTEYREDNRPLGLRTEADRCQIMHPKRG